jgi:hypothetical protein
MDEVDAEAVDLGHALRERVQLRLAPAPVVAGAPVGHQGLDRRQLHALRLVCDQLRGSSNNGTVSGDSGLKTAGLPPPAVRM